MLLADDDRVGAGRIPSMRLGEIEALLKSRQSGRSDRRSGESSGLGTKSAPISQFLKDRISGWIETPRSELLSVLTTVVGSSLGEDLEPNTELELREIFLLRLSPPFRDWR